METKIFRMSGSVPDQKDMELLNEAGDILKSGGLVAFPTETVYGLGGDALNPESSRKIYAAKGRPSDNPLIVHVCEMEDIEKITSQIPDAGRRLAEAFWPGPMTLIFPKNDRVPKETTGGLETVAVRMPSDPIARELIRRAGGFVAAPSANLSGKPSPTKAEYVIQDMDGRIDAIIDGGENEIGLESTIVDVTVDPPQVLRPGYITNDMVSRVLGIPIETDRAILQPDSGIAPKAPGMKYRHYAPSGSLTVVEGDRDLVVSYINEQTKECVKAGETVAVIATDDTKALYEASCVFSTGETGDDEAVAKHLYTILRRCDDEGISVIYSESFAEGALGQAIMNRLLKAAGHKVVRLGDDK